ncbi:MAG: hypothetical protein AB7U45_00060 [Desulfamplus sp.]
MNKNKEIIDKIIRINSTISNFWSNSYGWAPIEAANLMNKARLDWQVSLSKCLQLWLCNNISEYEDGGLILAWTNLGSLIEGTLKLFLSVFYKDYEEDIKSNLGKINEKDYKYLKNYLDKKNMKEPDGLELSQLILFFDKRNIWSQEWEKEFVKKVQKYRNTIHAYKDRELGTIKEFEDCVQKYLTMLESFYNRLPHADNI